MQRVTKTIEQLQPGESIVVGSGDGVDLRLAADGVDPQHARFARQETGLVVQDLDSRRGTFVNGTEVRGLVPLGSGDTVRLGNVEIVLDGLARSPATTAARSTAAMPMRSRAAGSAGLAVSLRGATKAVTVREGLHTSRRTILDDVSVHVRPGEFVGILGASGSGKSTLIKAVAGLTGLSHGTVYGDNYFSPATTMRSPQ